jgi:capsular polysaccharide biosynthesis protein
MKEIDLIETFVILWKKKWLILLPTAVFVIAAGALSFLFPTVWQVDSVIQPGRVQSQTAQGAVEEINLVNRIIALINEKAYHQRIATELNLGLEQLSAITALHASNATFFKLVIRDRDAEKAKKASSALFKQIKLELDPRQDAEREKLAAEIKENESSRERVTRNLEILDDRLSRLDKNEQEIDRDKHNVLQRIRALTEEQSKKLNSQEKSESDAKGPMQYSAVIKDNMTYYDALTKSRDEFKTERESLVLKLQETRQRSQALAAALAELAEKKRRLVPMKFVTEPMVSSRPVAARMPVMVLAAGLLSVALFTVIALLTDALDKRRARVQ